MSLSLSTLEAVNDMLRAIGQPDVTSVPASDDGTAEWQASQILARTNEKVQMRGWHYNTEVDRLLSFASVKLTGTITGSALVKGELVTQATSGAQGYLLDAYEAGDTTFYVCPIEDSEDFNGANNITGATSGNSTDTISAVASASSGQIVLPDNLISFNAYGQDAWRKLTARNGYLYDLDDNTATFTANIRTKTIELITFTYLPQIQADYITAMATIEFMVAQRRAVPQEAYLTLRKARASAMQEQNDLAPQNTLHTRHARRVKGNRNDIIFRQDVPNA